MKKKRMNEEEDRIRTNITLPREVFNIAVDYKINLSSFLENQLINYFNMRHQLFNQETIQYPTPYTTDTYVKQLRQSQNVTEKTSMLYGEMGLSEFESESLAPKAKRMDQATLQAQHTR